MPNTSSAIRHLTHADYARHQPPRLACPLQLPPGLTCDWYQDGIVAAATKKISRRPSAFPSDAVSCLA